MRRYAAALAFAFALVLAIPTLAAAAGESPYRVEGARRVVAFADVHGAYDELVALLRSQGAIDGSLRWSGADTQLVSLGDLVDRGPDDEALREAAWQQRRQIDAMLKRRDLLLREHGARTSH